MNEAVASPAVVVTGASSGIGREIARLAAKDGHTVVLVGRSERPLHALAAELQAQGSTAKTLALNLESPDALVRIDELLAASGLYCDVLVNSAGFGVFGPAAKADRNLQIALIDVNIRAVTALTLRFLPAMVERRRGGIINVGSITGYAPGPYMATYCASKAFIRSFSAALSAEVAGSGVTVTCLTPGVVRTAFFDREPMGQRQGRLLKILPRGDVMMTANIGWKSFKAGKSIVVPRFIDKFVIAVCSMLPDRALARLVSSLQRNRQADTPA
jgi:short-subunit dehydrogenase